MVIIMSLWLESLYQELHYSDDAEARAKTILSYLAMPVPRQWWQRSLDTGDVDQSYVEVLYGCYKELMELPELANTVDIDLLLAMAFIDDAGESERDIDGFNIEQHLARARQELDKRPELNRLAGLIRSRING